jgi:hypothetical protein
MIVTALVAALVFWLGYDGGAYGLESRTTLAIGVIWTGAITVALGVWPVRMPPRAALAAGALLAAFAAFTLASTAWAASAEKALAEFNRTALYLGVFTLAALAAGAVDRAWIADGIALGIVAVAASALAARFFPHVVSAGDVQTLLPTAHTRLSYPVDYWNGLAIMLALAYPLLLRVAVARPPVVAGLALASLPGLAAAIYLTSSRGGAATAIVGVVVFLALCGRRSVALAAIVVAGVGSLAAIAVLRAWPALVNPPLGQSAPGAQGRNAALLILLACVATGLAFALLRRYAGELALDRRAGVALAALAGAAVVAGLAFAHPVRRFDEFKRPPVPSAAGQADFVQSHLLSTSGSGRWQFWSSALDELGNRPVGGRGAGSFEAWWAAHGSLPAFVRNAHSLYLEVLGELGLIGFLLLAGALLTGLIAAARRALVAQGSERATAAALAAAFLAFAVAAGVDWVWQIAAVSTVGIACLGLAAGSGGGLLPRVGRRARAAAAVAGLALLAAQAFPLLGDLRIGDSQDAVLRGDTKAAIADALSARDLEPWASSPYLQLALVTEQAGDLIAADGWIRQALRRDELDWRLWLVASRIEAKEGRVRAARASLDRALQLNLRSLLFSLKRGR